MTTPTPTPIKPTQSDACPCPDPEKLRRLKEGLLRNATATSRIIDQILAELEEREAA